MTVEVDARPIAVLPSREHEFQWLLAKLPVAAYTCDAHGLITYFNDQAVEFWGRAPALNDPVDRFCGSFKLFSSDGTPIRHDECWMALALRDGESYNGREIIVERPDGSRVTALAHANPVRDEHGRVSGAVNVLVDISERKAGERALAQLAAIVRSSDDAIISKNLDGIIQSWNGGAERLFGWTAEEAVGKSITLIIPPDRLDEEKRILATLRRGERIEHYETVRVSKYGRMIDVSLTTSPIRDSSGKVVAASKVARDITARKLAQAALVAVKDELATQLADIRRLHEMSARLASTLELAPILNEILRTAATIQDADMGILSLFRPGTGRLEVGASLGFAPELIEDIERQPLEKTVCGIAFLEHRRLVIEDFERAEPRFQNTLGLARRAGTRAVHCTPLRTRRGAVIGMLSLHFRAPRRASERETHLIDLCARQAVDFIENAQLYTQLRETDRAKNEFLATLAHELRNPLAPIRNAAHILQLQNGATPEMRWASDVIERQMKQMTRLVDDLLDVARITGNKLELRRERIELGEIIRVAAETSRPLLESSGHAFTVEVPPEPIEICADLTRIAQALSNLLNNAAKFTPRGGHVTLTAKREGDGVEIVVRDDGLGIPPEMLPLIFEMFTQVNRSLDRSQGGLGIGLSLVKRLVEMHGGAVYAHSDGPGTGSTFRVWLPIGMSSDAAGEDGASAASGSPRGERVKVLVVDDNRDSATSLGALLQIAGHEVRTAFGGMDGLVVAKEFEPEVVLLDIGMPGMDGYAIAEEIRKQPWARDALLIAVTGWGHEEDRVRSRRAGFDHHLVKPVDPTELVNLVAKARKAA